MARSLHAPSNIEDLQKANLKRRAAGLARMLMYAELDARDLGDKDVAKSIREASDLTRSTFGLSEDDLFNSA